MPYAEVKRVYFVRHGVTEANETGAFQLSETPLSEKGAAQAHFVAERFRAIPIDAIVTSSMLRARETAHEISVVTGCAITESPLFHELLRPSIIRGRNPKEPGVGKVYEQVLKNFTDTSARHSDEENFFDLRERADKAVRFLEDFSGKHIAVVTHGMFLKMLIARMWFPGGDVTPEEFARTEFFLHPSNTGITKCVLTEYGWRLWTWNDDAHLGEKD